jgi:hypothetical protein
MYCTGCGHLLRESAKFCGKCGKAIASRHQQASANQPSSKPVSTEATRSVQSEMENHSALRASDWPSPILGSLRRRWVALASIAALLLLTIIGIARRRISAASIETSALLDLKVKDADDLKVMAKMREIAADPATHALAEDLGARLDQLDSDESAASAASSGVSWGSHRKIFSSSEPTVNPDAMKSPSAPVP